MYGITYQLIVYRHNYMLVKKQSRLDVSVNMFKNKIDKYLVKAGYT